MQSARMVDFSEAGLAFVSPLALVGGEVVCLRIEDCEINAEVRYCRRRELGSEVEFMTGVEILRILKGEEIWRSLFQVS